MEAPKDAGNDPDRDWLARVAPPGRCNPEPSGRYNLVTIGGGTAGLVASIGTGVLGGKTALIEGNRLGGDCLNHGCVPSKALLAAARAAHGARGAPELGIDPGAPPSVDFPRVMQRLRETRARIAHHDAVKTVESFGVEVFFGQARFVDDDALEVDGRRLRFSRAVIATGGHPRLPQVRGVESVGVRTNETIFDLDRLPARLVVIGGGPIGIEMAQAFARLGSKVTVLEHGDRILSKDDPEAADIVHASLRGDGVRFVFGAQVCAFEHGGGEKMVIVEHEGARLQIPADEILVAIGRVPNMEGLELEQAGVRHDERGVQVDDLLRTSNRRIYAAGDVCSPYKFTHAADAMARAVIRNALFFGRTRHSALVIPHCTYTAPELAHVGLTPAEAERRGIEIDTFTDPFGELDRAIVDDQENGFVRIHLARGTDTIVGATIVASRAGDLMGELSLAMSRGIGLRHLADVVHPYPTQSESIRRVADQYNQTRLRPWLAQLLARFLAWRR